MGGGGHRKAFREGNTSHEPPRTTQKEAERIFWAEKTGLAKARKCDLMKVRKSQVEGLWRDSMRALSLSQRQS